MNEILQDIDRGSVYTEREKALNFDLHSIWLIR